MAMKVIDHGVFFSFFDHLYDPIKLVLLLFISKKLHLRIRFLSLYFYKD